MAVSVAVGVAVAVSVSVGVLVTVGVQVSVGVRVTVGVQARAGLFSNEITCITQPTERGNWPQSQQSIRIKTGEIY